jgi:hypothetical protein
MKKRLLTLTFLLGCMSGGTALSASFDCNKAATEAMNCGIITASGVRLRSAPNTSTKVLAILNLGTLVEQLGKSAKPAVIGKTKAHWYQIRLADGNKGWVFGTLFTALEPSRKAETFRDLARQRLGNKKLKFGEVTDLVEFLNRVSGEVAQTTEIAAELKLMHLQAVQRVIDVVGWDFLENPHRYKAWFNKQEKQQNIYFVDFGSAGWFVNPDRFWTLSQQYRHYPIGENIAWQAANLPLGGECEGYIPCYLQLINKTTGQYLVLYPQGKHVQAAFKDAVDWISPDMDVINEGPIYVGVGNHKEERKGFIESLRKLCKALTPVNHPKKAFVLGELDKWFKQLGSSNKCSQ